ncbi:hypothetical protein [uncultured Alistipes sp.]|uniref:hypothetical protein n=1 Tax=uncultured Alistipes sp. TaxID=538949 RepID=UPI0028041C8C|nr:hypothetical protein [uncultured Alistipes sp.]
MNIFKKFKAYLRFREAVKRADEAHQRDGQRYYVLPAKGKLVIMDRRNFRILRRKGYISRNANVPSIPRHCIYYTADGSGRGGHERENLTSQFHRYLEWLQRNK